VSGENRLGLVRAAVARHNPERVPMLFFNRDFEQSDIILADVVHHFQGPGKDRSEWGFTWERLDRTMGQPRSALLRDWSDLGRLGVPDPGDPERFAGLAETRALYGERYYLGSLALSGFTVMSCLRGFPELLADLMERPRQTEALADLVFGFEEEVLHLLPARGFHGAAFFDDWGTQDSLLLSPGLWRERFLPRYRRQFALAHGLGLDVYFHTCGQVAPLIPDLIEAGVDLLNLSQPNLFDLEQLGARFAGKVCFVCPVSYQTTAISGSEADIRAEVARLVKHLARNGGGLIGYVEEYQSIGLSEANYQACVRAFRELGGGPEWTRLTAPPPTASSR
jgi:uroporphyrinogen decarboxylase